MPGQVDQDVDAILDDRRFELLLVATGGGTPVIDPPFSLSVVSSWCAAVE